MRKRVIPPGKKRCVPGIYLFILIICAGLNAAVPLPCRAESPLIIATVLSETGSRAKEGRAIKNGINMYVDQVNRQGGIRGSKIKVLVFDDESRTDNAMQKAKEVAASDALIVLGHQYSAQSVEAGRVYREKKIPAVTGTSTADRVTRGNPWFFRTVFTNGQQARMCANYARYVLGHKTATIIYDENDYGRSLKVGFLSRARKIELDIEDIHIFGSERDRGLSASLDEIAEMLLEMEDPGIIFLAAAKKEGSHLIRRIRDAGRGDLTIMSANRIGDLRFVDKFAALPMERGTPGFYTQGIFATTEMLFDVANQRAHGFKREFMRRYKRPADANAAGFYDAAMVAVEALKKADVTGKDRAGDRQKIRECLAGINTLGEAVRGVTGMIYFDENGDAVKSIPMGAFRDNRFVSAAVQLAPVTRLGEVNEYDDRWRRGEWDEGKADVIRVQEGLYLQETRVVYTGIHFNKISGVDLKTAVCDMDFFLWFRYEGELDTKRIEFLNAEKKKIMRKLVEKEDEGRTHYRLYHIKGRFRIDYLPDRFSYNSHAVGISLRHQDLTRDRLIFVVDLLKMDPESMLAEMKSKKVLEAEAELIAKNISFFQSVEKRNSMGNPSYRAGRGQLSYSGFNALIDAENGAFSIRGIIRERESVYVFSTGFVLLLMTLARFFPMGKRHGRLIWFLEFSSLMLMLLAGEVLLVGWQAERMNYNTVRSIILIASLLWWLVPAYSAVQAIRTFFLDPLEERSGRKIPHIVYHMVTSIVYTLALFGVVAFVFDQKLTGILATSGVLAMIIGLAIQINISNIFSGIAINLERPFRVGDWVKIEEYKEACVADVTWRTTRLKTRDGCILSIPNSVASEAVVQNYNYPDDRYELLIYIDVEPFHRPERVIKIANDALHSLDFILNQQNAAGFRGYTEWSARFVILPMMKDYAEKNRYRSMILRRLWDYLDRAGIKPAVPRTEIRRIPRVNEGESGKQGPVALLDRLPLFDPFSEKVKEKIGRELVEFSFEEGAAIPQNRGGDTVLFIIEEGIVRALTPVDRGENIEVTRLGPGSFFGGGTAPGEKGAPVIFLEALSKVKAFRLEKEVILPYIETVPGFFDHLKRELNLVQDLTSNKRWDGSPREENENPSGRTLLKRIQQFFSRRKHERIDVPGDLEIAVAVEGEVMGRLDDIGKGGIRVSCSGKEKDFKEGDSVGIEIHVQGILEESVKAGVGVSFTERRSGSKMFGLNFPELSEKQAGQISRLMDSISQRRGCDAPLPVQEGVSLSPRPSSEKPSGGHEPDAGEPAPDIADPG